MLNIVRCITFVFVLTNCHTLNLFFLPPEITDQSALLVNGVNGSSNVFFCTSDKLM